MTGWVKNLDNFHLGKPMLVLAAIALISGIAIGTRREAGEADLTVWVFAESHDKTYRQLIPRFEKEHNVKVNLSLLNARAVTVRLGQIFMSNQMMRDMPDLVEVEINLAGRFFRPPVHEIGFMPLNVYLTESGLDQQLVQSRLATWSKQGIVFGIPHDVHPCTITYRHDLFWGVEHADGTFEGPRIDLPACKTWPQLQEACLNFKKYWRTKGYKYRHALEMPESSSENFQAMLLQRGINPIDSYGNVYLDVDPRVAQTLAFYAQLVAGPNKCTTQTQPGWVAFARDVAEGSVAAYITPDWRMNYFKRYGAPAFGKMRMMPLPVFDKGDSPTSTIGGTMMGVVRASPRPEQSLKLLEYLYFSEDGIRIQNETNEIIPPIKSMWTNEMFHRADPFFGGQRVEELYAQLAPQIPPRYVTAATPIVNLALNDAVAKAVNYVEEHGADAGLEPACKAWLADMADDLRKRIKQWRLDS